MAFELRTTRFGVENPIQWVTFFAGEANEDEPQQQWITGQVHTGGTDMKSIALNQILVLRRARDLLDAEIERLMRRYQEAEQAQQ